MNKVIEYLAFGVPVVSFDLSESRVSAGDAAEYVHPATPQNFASAIDDMLAAPRRRRTMAEKGRRKFLQELSWEHQAAAYVSVYRSLLADDRADVIALPREPPLADATGLDLIQLEPRDQGAAAL